MDGDDQVMKREIEFIKSATEKLRNEGDVSEDEATRIFILATVVYAYEMGETIDKQYRNSFRDKLNVSEISEALGKWYKEVFSRISDDQDSSVIPSEYYNFVASIPSPLICPPTNYVGYRRDTSMMETMRKMQDDKINSLRRNFNMSNSFYADKQMVDWLKCNVPLSFDVMGFRHGEEVEFARFGILKFLPIYQRKIKVERVLTLSEFGVPRLQHGKMKIEGLDRFYLIACPLEYKDIVDAVADGLPIPEMPPEKKSTHTPKDIEYINSLTSRLPFQDITPEEADDLYLLFKMYQALKIATRRGMKEAVEPGLNALLSWYRAIEKELKKNKRGNFVYTLPSDLDMNLYQLRKPIERCLETLPKEPPEVVTRYEDRFSVKDTLLDTKCTKVTGVSDKYIRYHSSRYGFFKRNDIDLEQWKPVIRCRECAGDDIFDRSLGIPILGKLRFAEFSLGIKQVVMGDVVAVKEEDYQKMLEVLNLSNSKIMEIADILFQKELNEIRAKKKELPRTPENAKELDALDRMENILKRDGILLEHVIKGVGIAYKAQKARKEYIDEGDWMEIDR